MNTHRPLIIAVAHRVLGAGSTLLDDVVDASLLEVNRTLAGAAGNADAERRYVREITQRHATSAFAARQRERVLASRRRRQRTRVSRTLPPLRQVALAA